MENTTMTVFLVTWVQNGEVVVICKTLDGVKKYFLNVVGVENMEYVKTDKNITEAKCEGQVQAIITEEIVWE